MKIECPNIHSRAFEGVVYGDKIANSVDKPSKVRARQISSKKSIGRDCHCQVNEWPIVKASHTGIGHRR